MGGYTVWGRLCPASESLSRGLLSLGLAQGIKVISSVPKGSPLSWQDVAFDPEDVTVRTRKAMEKLFTGSM